VQAVGLLPKIVQDVLSDLSNAIGVQQGLFVLCGAELFSSSSVSMALNCGRTSL
jgi:hypothetical protein